MAGIMVEVMIVDGDGDPVKDRVIQGPSVVIVEPGEINITHASGRNELIKVDDRTAIAVKIVIG